MMPTTPKLFRATLILGLLLLISSCASPPPADTTDKYPSKPAENPERKSGPAMFFLEAAEEDADPNKVIVIPPSDEKTKTSEQPPE